MSMQHDDARRSRRQHECDRSNVNCSNERNADEDTRMIQQLLEKIRTKKALIGVVGLGYVGLPLVREFIRAGMKVIGFDVDPSKIKALTAGRSYIKHIPASVIKTNIKAGRFRATDDFSQLKKVDAIIICVPTPLDKMREPDVSFIESSGQQDNARHCS